MEKIFLRRAASILIVVSLLLTSFTGILFLGGEAVRSEAGVLYDEDMTINEAKNMTNVIMTANLVIGQGGVVTVDHGSLIFSQSSYTGEQFTLIIEDGGKLILKNATLSTQMDNIKAFPSLGVMVRNNGTIEAYDSTLMFSGHMVVDDSNLVLWRSSIKGFEPNIIMQYCDDNLFPRKVFATSPTLFFVSANVGIYDNSTIEDIYEPDIWNTEKNYLPTMYSHDYSFATDVNNASGSKESVEYSLNRMPSSVASNNTAANQVFSNLTTDDSTYFQVANGQTMWLGGFDTAGLVFSASESIAPVLSIKYMTGQSFPSNGGYIYYQYRNGTEVRTATQLTNTYDASSGTSKDLIATVNLPTMSVQDLYGLQVGYQNAAGSSVYINKVWTSLSYQVPTYKNITLAGSTTLTVIDSYLGVDFSNKPDHNQLVLTDNSRAEMYGVSIDTTQIADPESQWLPAYVTIEKTVEVTPYSLDISDLSYPDDSTQNIAGLQVIGDSSVDVVGPGKNLHINQFNTSGLIGPISNIGLSIRYHTASASFTQSYIQWSKTGLTYTNSTIAPAPSVSYITNSSAMDIGQISSMEAIGNLEILFSNHDGVNSLTIDKLWMDVTLRPTVHIYRWADITAVDTQALPVDGAEITFTNPSPVYYVSGQAQAVPPADVLRYLGVSEADFFKTNASGKAAIPLLADTIYQTSSNPNSRPTSTYNVMLSYVKGVDTYYGLTNVSFMKVLESGVVVGVYPNLDPAYMRSSANALLNDLVLDLPDLYVGTITVTPSPAYAGMNLDIQVVVGNQGNTAMSNVEVVISGLLYGTDTVFNYTTTLNVVLSHGSTIAQAQWLNVSEGTHVVAVTIDPNGSIPEVLGGKDNNKKSQPVTVLPNLADLSISSSDIVFIGPSPSTSAPVTAVITVHNDGRAAANDVLVQVYIAGDKNSGQLVNTTHVTVGPGASADAMSVWKPNVVGTYPIYVYLNADGRIIEYSYENDYASTTITVSLVSDPSDWLFDGTPAHANQTLPGTTDPFEVWTNLTIEDYGNLTLDGTRMSIAQTGAFALQVTVRDNGVLILKNGAQLSSNFEMRLYLLGNGKLVVDSSSILPNVKIQADDYSVIEIESSTIGVDVVAPDTSHATITAANTTFGTAWSLFGGYAQADLTNVTMPYLKAYGHAVINHYRWIVAEVVDGNGMPLQNSYVEVNHITKPISYSGYTGADGKVVFRAICDIYSGDMVTQNMGSYLLNTTYTFDGIEYDGANGLYPVSLQNFTAAPHAVVSVVEMQVPGALPDLDPPLILSTTTPLRNETVTVSTVVSNVGVVPAYNVLVLFNDTGSTFFSKVIDVINPGETVPISTTWRAGYPIAPQQHNISVVIDPYNEISELFINNNLNYTFVTVQGITELSVKQADVALNPYAPVIGSWVNISATVRNGGDISANNVLVSFYAQSTAPGAPELLLSEQNIALIGVGGSGVAKASWLPGLAGNYNIRIAINGVTSLTFVQNVLNYADLTPSNILFTPASPVVVNTDVKVEAVISNIGQIAAYNLVVRFYVGDTGTGALIGETIVPVIEAGQTKVVSATWKANISNGQKTQDQHLTVWVNPQHLIAETDYDNNIRNQTLKVNEIRPDIFFPEAITVTSSGAVVSHASQGETIKIATNVSNSGNTPALAAKIVFYVRDADNKTVVIGTVLKDIGVGEGVNVNATWAINLMRGNYTIVINANPDRVIDESNTTNDQVSIAFVIDAPTLSLTLNSLGAESYAPGSVIFVSGRVVNEISSEPLSGVAITVYISQAGERKGADWNTTTDLSGNFAISVFIPNGLSGEYQVNAVASNDDKSTASTGSITVKSGTDTGVPWWVYLLILVCIATVIIGFSMYLYKYGLGKMVECGECGALIPESSRRCPKCGVEFEVGTAKCSECHAWIPSNSTSCPECNAKFISEAIEEEEDAYLKKMRGQYESYVETFRDEAKRVLGKKYHDGKFSEWWKKQPTYISFESWLAQEEHKRKVGGTACPSCGTLNPRGATTCHKCGSVIERPTANLSGADEQKQDDKKPLRRIVRRPVEKKAVTAPEEVKPAEEPAKAPEEDKPQN